MEGRIVPLRVARAGRPQRHFYVDRLTRMVKAFQPDVVFLEQESFACAAMQWALVSRRYGVPFGVQSDENLDRDYPLPARLMRRWVLDRAAFVAARSPTAATRVEEWGAKGRVAVIPHAVPLWDRPPDARSNTFTVGFAGRFVPEKGIHDLVAATARMTEPVRLLLVGDGPLRDEIEAMRPGNVSIEVRRDVPHARMPEAYSEMDVLVLPSRTMAGWAEQFGRVLVEALSCGVPVVGSDSGEIAWVVNTTGGGCVFREGDVAQLVRILENLRAQPAERRRLADHGRAVVSERFTADACARDMAELLNS
jgi:glycosyltransferase involved in cell wall biosynthesis